MRFTRTSYVVLFVILISVGITSAFATITLADPTIITGILDMMSNKITNVGSPTVSTDAATKGYVDSVVSTDADTLDGIDSTGFAKSSQTCSVGQLVTGFDSTGNEICKTPQLVTTEGIIISSAGQMFEPFITLDSSGIPVISYSNVSTNDLEIIICGNTTCSSGNTIAVIDSTGSVGQSNSIALDTSDIPVIAYRDSTNQDLKVVKCGNTTCSSGNIITTVDSDDAVGLEPSIILDVNNIPIISYFDETNSDLKVVKCGNASCSSGNLITTVDSSDSVGRHSSIALDSSDIPVISYADDTNGALKVVKCSNTSCSSGNTITTVDSTISNFVDTSLAIDSTGLPVIAYRDFSGALLKVVKCGNSSCSSSNTITSIETSSVQDLSLAIDSNDIPTIVYGSNVILKMLECGDTSCSSGNTITVLDDNYNTSNVSVIFDSQNEPVITYTRTGVLRIWQDSTQTISLN